MRPLEPEKGMGFGVFFLHIYTSIHIFESYIHTTYKLSIKLLSCYSFKAHDLKGLSFVHVNLFVKQTYQI